MKGLISLGDAKKEFARNLRKENCFLCNAILDKVPMVDAEMVQYAWYDNHQCTKCGAEAPTDNRLDFMKEEDISFCWNCGAKIIKHE